MIYLIIVFLSVRTYKVSLIQKMFVIYCTATYTKSTTANATTTIVWLLLLLLPLLPYDTTTPTTTATTATTHITTINKTTAILQDLS